MIGRMMMLALLATGSVAGAQEAAPSQEQEPTVRIDLRVSASGVGALVMIDRGASDGLRVDDTVVFRPREGGVWRGTVRRVEERSASVEMLDPAFVPVAGTRGEVVVPRARLTPATPAPQEPADTPPPGAGEEAGAEGLPPHPGWTDPDAEWEPGRPLLARVRAVRPEDRAELYGGRLTLFAETSRADDHDHTLLRLGSDLWVENPFGFGGRMDFDVAYDQFAFNTPDADDDDVSEFRVERLSYRWGGTRFNPERVQVGRFLQEGMPEFGVLDGIEWEHRLPNRHRVGASLGYMPSPDVEFESFDDLQIAGFYEWVVEGRADLSLAAGLQKTWHDGSPDRDLIVSRFDYLPPEGWDLRGGVWLDIYDSGDDAGSGLGVTHAQVSTARTFERDTLDVTYRHLEFPDLLRNEFVESAFEDLADSAYDRVSVAWRRDTDGGTRLHATTGLWRDEEERGADVDVGADRPDVWLDGDDLGVAVFATRGAFSTDAGMRFNWGLGDDEGRWDLYYQFADRHQDEFSHESDDLWEHALRATRALYLKDGWHASVSGEARRFDDELDLSLTLYVQKTF